MALPVPDPLLIVVDHAQLRIKRDRLATLLDGKAWGQSFRQDCFVDPVTATGMLMPSLFDPQWSATSAGRFARLRKSDYTLTTPNAWVEFDRGRCVGDYYLHSQGTNEAAIVTSPFERNRGVFLSVYNYSVGNETKRIILDCGWNPVSVETEFPDLGIRFFSNGEIEIYRNGVLDGTGALRGEQPNVFDGSQQPGETANRTLDIMILPFRRREVLIVTNQGTGFSHVVQGIAEDDEDPTIHAEGNFFWHVPEGKATVQCAKATFAPSGYLTAVHTVFLEAPETGEIPESLIFADLYGGDVTASLVARADPDSPFIPDGDKRECRIKLDVTGVTGFTPNIYGAQVYFNPLFARTPNEEVELVETGNVVTATLSVPASHTDVELSVTLNSPDDLEFGDAQIALLRDIENRPISVRLGDIPIIDGFGENPEFRSGRAGLDSVSSVVINVRDSWQRLHEYIFSDVVPLDGMNLADAFEFIAKTAGFDDAEIDIDPIDFDLPTSGTNYDGEFAVTIRVGDRAADAINKLHQTYCPLFFIGVVPTETGPVLRIKDNELLSWTPDITIYPTIEDARIALVGSAEWSDADFRRYASAHVWKSYKRDSIALETNEIWVQGFDHRVRKPILVRVQNNESKDPELSKTDRPMTWLGAPRKYAWTDPTLTTKSSVIRAARVLCKRLFPRRYFVEWESDFLIKSNGVPIWRGDVVELFDHELVRVVSLSGEFRKEPFHDAWHYRPFRYVGEIRPEALGSGS